MRWEPETAVVAAAGVALAPFQVPGSPEQMAITVRALAETVAVVWSKHGIVTRSDASATAAADLVEYIEAAAHHGVMNLGLGSPAAGLEPTSARRRRSGSGSERSHRAGGPRGAPCPRCSAGRRPRGRPVA